MASGDRPNLGRGKTGVGGGKLETQRSARRCSSAPAQFHKKTCAQAARMPNFKSSQKSAVCFSPWET